MQSSSQKEEKKSIACPNIVCTRRGNQLVFATETDEPVFQPRLEYVVGIKDYFQESRRVRSFEQRKGKVAADPFGVKQEQGDLDILKDVVIEIAEEKKEEEKHLATAAAGAVKRRVVRNKWSLLRTVIRAVALFRRNEAQTIRDTEGLERALETYSPHKTRAMSYYVPHRGEFDDVFKEEHMYHLIARGAPEDIVELEGMLNTGKEAYLFDIIDENNVVNRPNRLGHTPLYIASQNGNLEIIKFLLKKRANVQKKSKVGENEEEGNLAVAARWKHEKVVEYFLENCEWSARDLSQAKAVAGTKKINTLVARKLAHVKGSACCFCCIPSKKKDPKPTPKQSYS